MLDFFSTLRRSHYIIARPPRREFGTRAAQLLYQLGKPCLAHVPTDARPEDRQIPPRRTFPVYIEPARERVREDKPKQVALVWRQRREVHEDAAGGLVPRDHIPAGVGDVRCIDTQRI